MRLQLSSTFACIRLIAIFSMCITLFGVFIAVWSSHVVATSVTIVLLIVLWTSYLNRVKKIVVDQDSIKIGHSFGKGNIQSIRFDQISKVIITHDLIVRVKIEYYYHGEKTKTSFLLSDDMEIHHFFRIISDRIANVCLNKHETKWEKTVFSLDTTAVQKMQKRDKVFSIISMSFFLMVSIYCFYLILSAC